MPGRLAIHCYPPEVHTIKEEGLIYKYFDKKLQAHVLFNPENNTLEFWRKAKDYAGYKLKYKNTHLEFCSSL